MNTQTRTQDAAPQPRKRGGAMKRFCIALVLAYRASEVVKRFCIALALAVAFPVFVAAIAPMMPAANPSPAKQADEDAKKPVGWSLTEGMRQCLANSLLTQMSTPRLHDDGGYAAINEIIERCDVRWYEKAAAHAYIGSLVGVK
jgi:hypothetical protein